jgi:hypothetical protein
VAVLPRSHANQTQLGEESLEDKYETSIETNTMLEEEALAVLWKWSVLRKRKNMAAESSTKTLSKLK